MYGQRKLDRLNLKHIKLTPRIDNYWTNNIKGKEFHNTYKLSIINIYFTGLDLRNFQNLEHLRICITCSKKSEIKNVKHCILVPFKTMNKLKHLFLFLDMEKSFTFKFDKYLPKSLKTLEIGCTSRWQSFTVHPILDWVDIRSGKFKIDLTMSNARILNTRSKVKVVFQRPTHHLLYKVKKKFEIKDGV